MADEIRGPRVYRPDASATWTHTHRWGSTVGDSTDLTVKRIDGGALTIRYGNESIKIRDVLVGHLATMVSEAAAWTDTPAPTAADESGAGA